MTVSREAFVIWRVLDICTWNSKKYVYIWTTNTTSLCFVGKGLTIKILHLLGIDSLAIRYNCAWKQLIDRFFYH